MTLSDNKSNEFHKDVVISEKIFAASLQVNRFRDDGGIFC